MAELIIAVAYQVAVAVVTSYVISALTPTKKVQGPQVGDMTVTGSSYGAVLSVIEGHPRLGGQIIWSSEKRKITTTTEEGGKGGGGTQVTGYTAEVDLLIAFTGCPADGLLRVFFGGDMVFSEKVGAGAASIINSLNTPQWDRMTFYDGNPNQLPDPDYEAAVGIGNAPAYRDRACIFWKGLKLGNSGQLPNITAEIARSVTTTPAQTFFYDEVGGGQIVVPSTFGGEYEDLLPYMDFVNIRFGASSLKAYLGDYHDDANNWSVKTLERMERQKINVAEYFTYECWVYVTAYPLEPIMLFRLSGPDETIIPGAPFDMFAHHGLALDETGHIYPIIHSGGYTSWFPGPDIQSDAYWPLSDIGAGGAWITNKPPVDIVFWRSDPEDVIKNPHILPLNTWVHVVMQSTLGAIDTWCEGFGHRHSWGIYERHTYIDGVHTVDYPAGYYPLHPDVYRLYERAHAEGDVPEDGHVLGQILYPPLNAIYGRLQIGASSTISVDSFSLSREAVYREEYAEPAAPFSPNAKTLSVYNFDELDALSSTDPTVAAVVTRLCESAGLSPSQFSCPAIGTLSQEVHGLVISQATSARAVIEILMGAYFFDCVLSDKIYFKSRAGPAIDTIEYDELGWSAGEPSENPFLLKLENELEMPAQLALTYNNIDGDYQTDTQYSDRIVTGQRSTEVVQLPLGLTASEAKIIADARLLDAYVALLKSNISLCLEHAEKEPTDPVLITAKDGSIYRMRLMRRTDADCVLTYDVVLDDATVFDQLGLTVGGTGSQTTVAGLPNTDMELLDIPLLRDADNRPGIYVAVKGDADNWRRGSVFHSTDDVTYVLDEDISTEAVFGRCTSVLGDWTGGTVFDEMSSVTVNVDEGELSGVMRAEMLNSNSVNVALLGTEIVQFRDATLLSAGVYRLTGFIRGRRGTEWAMTGHVIGERFVKLGTSGMRFLPLEASDLGRTRYYKAVSAGKKLSSVPSEAVIPLGVNLEPFSPVMATADRTGIDTLLGWIRRTRLSTRVGGPLPPTIPLGEAAEAYEVEIFEDDTFAIVVRTLSSTTPSVLYTNSQQVADFGSGQTVLSRSIYQMSDQVGRGYPLQVTN